MPSTATSSTAERADTAAPDDRRERRAVTAVIVVAVVLFWLISTSWRPWELFGRAGFSADFYDEQARSFLRGRLSVRPEVPGPEGFLVDGNTYLYYGPFLAIVRVPLALFGDLFVGRMVRLSMLVALVVLGRWAARLARAARRVVRGDSTNDAIWPTVLLVAATLFSPALFASGWASVYHETEIWAFALAIVSVTLVAEWAAEGFEDPRRLGWAVAAIVATTLTRAPIGLGVGLSLGVLGLGLAWRSRDRGGRAGWAAIAGGLAPLVAHAAVNLAKFGTAFSVPGDKQVLSLNDPERAAFFEATGGSFFDLRFLPTTIVQYLRPDTIRFERLVPGIRFGPLAENRGSLDVETVTPASSLTVTATALVVLAVVGVVWLIARRGRTWLVLVAGGLAGALPSFLIGFVANRYLIDMLPPLVTGAAVGVWAVANRTASVGSTRPVLVLGVVVVVWGAWVNGALATWTLEAKSPGFTELRSDVDAALFGGGDVGTIGDVDESTPVPRDDVVGLAVGCAGTYIAEQGRWVALERAPGVFETTGTVDAAMLARVDAGEAPIRIAATSQWTIDLAPTPAGPAFVYATPTDPTATVVLVDTAVPFEHRTVVDPISREAFVEIGDGAALLPGSALDAVGPEGIAVGGDTPSTSPLCEKLDGRR